MISKSQPNRNSPTPLISVIIPTYNRGHLIGRAIQSVLEQSFQNFEIIVVDDCSEDNTEKIVKTFQDLDSRIRFTQHERNKGEAAARNTGIKMSRSPYITFQDSDDESLQDRLQKELEQFRKHSGLLGIVYSDMWRVNANLISYCKSPHIIPENGIIYRTALDYGVFAIGIGTAMIKKEVFVDVGLFDETFPAFPDFEFFIRASKQYYFCHIPEPLIKYHATLDSISSDMSNLITAKKMILEKYYDDIYLENKLFANHLFSIGNSLCRNGDVKEGRKFITRAIEKNPLDIRFYPAFIFSFLGHRSYSSLISLKNTIWPEH